MLTKRNHDCRKEIEIQIYNDLFWAIRYDPPDPCRYINQASTFPICIEAVSWRQSYASQDSKEIMGLESQNIMCNAVVKFKESILSILSKASIVVFKSHRYLIVLISENIFRA